MESNIHFIQSDNQSVLCQGFSRSTSQSGSQFSCDTFCTINH